MNLPHTLTVYPATITQEAQGNPRHSFSADATQTNVPCFLQPVSAKALETYMQMNISVSHTVFTRTALDIEPKDLLVIRGRQFNLVGIRNQCEMDKYWAYDLEEWLGTQKVSLT